MDKNKCRPNDKFPAKPKVETLSLFSLVVSGSVLLYNWSFGKHYFFTDDSSLIFNYFIN